MRVLVACEFSGVVRDAFAHKGHWATSCDLLPGESPDFNVFEPGKHGPRPHGSARHWARDVREVLSDGWDLMISHPPCRYIAVSGARWFKDRQREQAEALEFVRLLLDAPIPRIALENPISVISSRIRKPDQIVQPWQFWDGEPGMGEVKATCLWLKGLPKLVPTTPDEPGRIARVWRMAPSPTRSAERSRTFPGIAEAMADQWGTR